MPAPSLQQNNIEFARLKRMNAKYQTNRGSDYHGSEYPEFGELVRLLLELLANFFTSKFQGASLAKPANIAASKPVVNEAESDVDELLEDVTFGPTYSPMQAATRAANTLPVEPVTSTPSVSYRPSNCHLM